MARIGVGKRIAFASVPLIFLAGLAETCVRVTGAAETCPNRFSESQIWTCDPILEFKLDPTLGVLDEKLSRDGFRTHDFAPKRPGVYRILSLGDSCTFGMLQRGGLYGYVRLPYPLALEELLERRVGAGRFEVLNVGVPGYNTYQGLMLLRTRLRGLDPDLITVRYGWNDHFLGEGGPGGSPYRESESRLRVALEDVALHTALYPFARRLGLEARRLRGQDPQSLRASFAQQKRWAPAVPLPDYQRHLRRIVEIGHARGAEVWLLTAPRNPAPGEEAIKFTVYANKIPFDDLMKIHDEYAEATRAVGRELGVPVVDMQAFYRANDAQVRLFVESDVPHPSQWGHHLEAEALYRRLVERGIAPPRARAESRSSRAPARSPERSRATARNR